LQSSKPGAHDAMLHTRFVHTLMALPDVKHGRLQPPQFMGSVRGSTHAFPHVMSGIAHSGTHWFATQDAPNGHARPHMPQCMGSRSSETQALPHRV